MPLLKKHIFLYCIYVLLGSVGLFTTPPSAYALQCPAPELGPACENQSAPWLLPVAGNPIHLINGNNYLQHHDLYPHPKTPLLYVQRHYNAQALHHSILGRGWALHWDIRLQKNNQQLWLADGRRITFNPKKLQLNQNPNDLRLGKYQLQLGQHTTLWFNQQGYLIRLKENLPTQHRPTLLEIKRYAPNHPTLANQIKSLKQGQKQIKLNYHTHSATKKNERPHQHPPLLSKINSPFGEILYHYQWDHQTQQPKLKQVHYPDKRKILYHYEQPEHPFALTGVSIQLKNQKPIRIRYWWYDTYGRAIFSAQSQGTHWVRIDFNQTDSLVANTLSRTIYSAQGATRYSFQRHHRQWYLTGGQGPQCPGCPPVPLKSTIDDTGYHLHWPKVHWHHDHKGQRHLYLTDTPWPNLSLHFQPNGYLYRWYSELTGNTQLAAHSQRRQLQIEYANGDKANLYWKPNGQPHKVLFQGKTQPSQLNYLSSPALKQLKQAFPDQAPNDDVPITFNIAQRSQIHIQHPNEHQWWQLTEKNQIKSHQIKRQIKTPSGPIHWYYKDTFEYDKNHRLQRHQLFEGGQIIYRYNQSQQLKEIIWKTKKGTKISILRLHAPNLWQHANGLFSYFHTNDNNHYALLFSKNNLIGFFGQQTQKDLIQKQWQLWQPNTLNTKASSHPFNPATFHQYQQNFIYNEHKQMVGSHQLLKKKNKPKKQKTTYFAWAPSGQNQAHSLYSNLKTQRDPSGLIQQIQGGYLKQPRQLVYNSQRRLAAVFTQQKLIASYQHNAFGHRIYAYYPNFNNKLNQPFSQTTKTTKENIKTHQFFIYQGQRLVAQWEGDDSELTAFLSQKMSNTHRHPIKTRYIYLGDVPIAAIDYSKQTPTLFSIHSAFVGAPILATNSTQQIAWAAIYSPLGQAQQTTLVHQPEFHLALRFPGQYADPATGWHDNLLRTYDPYLGHYLEPDPLGPLPNHQPLGYAQQQPWRFIDPLGLLLFAFDGTRFDQELNSNVWQFYQRYENGAYYQSGPGNPNYLNWDAITAWRANQIIQTQWQHLLNEVLWLEPSQNLAIDIIGFSRGAALARHFSNQIIDATQYQWFHYIDDFGRQYQACIQPRFIGLFDTVAQFGIMGSQNHYYDLSIAPEWAWVAHAVALQEYRQLFPLYAIETADNRIQEGFIGAHSNIGGGDVYKNSKTPSGDLAKISLYWMLWQAQALGLSLNLDHISPINDPILHDPRMPYMRYLNTDRHVQTQQSSSPQGFDISIGQSIRAQTEKFIQRYENWQKRSSYDVGTVNLTAYYQWLEERLGWHPDNIIK